MLSYFRQHPLRPYLWLILLFAALSMQTQSLFACDLMDIHSNTACCCDENPADTCPMGGGCHSTDNNGLVSGCCNIHAQIKIGVQDAGDTDAQHTKPVLSLDAPQLPIAIIIAYQITRPLFEGLNKFVLNAFSPSLTSTGTQTFSETLRFRI